jgi:hypothetical protein
VAHAAKLWDLVKKEGMSHTKVVLDGRLPPAGALIAKRNNAGQPLSLDADSNDDDTMASAPSDNGYTRNWNNDDVYYAPPPRADGQRYVYRRPYDTRPVYRDDFPPPPFPFLLFGR